jgi:hypothetical protein
MAVGERLTYALIGSFFGALLGVGCWWLYGLGFSQSFNGSGIDPILRHWVASLSATFAALGFIFRAQVGDFIGDSLSAIFQFESQNTRARPVSVFFAIAFIALVIALTWFSAPT